MKLFISTIIAALAACLLIVVTQAFADESMIYRQGSDSIELFKMACPDKVLALIKPEHHNKFMGASGLFGGQHIAACWTPDGQGNVFILYEDGDYSGFPMSAFDRKKNGGS